MSTLWWWYVSSVTLSLLDEGFSKIHVAYDEEKRRREKNLPRLLRRMDLLLGADAWVLRRMVTRRRGVDRMVRGRAARRHGIVSI